MPDLLREQFPHFRPIVEAFGYRNLEFEGWEADDVIATLATRADEAGVKTCVVSTDRDAFQLVSENVCLMMTPRGVADVQVYTPERVEAALRDPARPDPGLHRAQGRHERQHPGRPRHRRQDRRAADRAVRLARGGRRARRRALARAVEGDRRERGAGARVEAPRDDAARPRARRRPRRRSCSQPPDRSRAEGDLPALRVPGAPRPSRHARRGAPRGGAAGGASRRPCAWREGDLPELRGRVGVAADADRSRGRDRGGEVIVAPGAQRTLSLAKTLEVVAHDAKALRLGEPAADDTMIAAYLIDPGRAEYELDDLMAEYGVELEPDPPAEEETAALVRHAEAARRLAGRSLAKVRERGSSGSTRDRAPAHRRARGDGGRGRAHRHVSHGRDHGAPERPDRGARGARVRARGRGVRARLAAAARAHPLREARADARPQGEDRLLDRRQGAARDPRRPRDRPGDRGVARADEAREHVPRPAADADRRGRAPAHDDQPDRRRDRAALDVEPEPAGDPDPHRARPRDPLGVRRRARAPRCSRRTTRRSSCASSRTSPASRSCARRSSAARTSTRRRRPRCSARIRRRSRRTSGTSRR